MEEPDIRRLLDRVRTGRLSVAQAVERLRHLPFEDLGFAKIDHHRALRQGFAETIFAPGKTPQQVAGIVRGMLRARASQHNILVTRAGERIYRAVRRLTRRAKFHPLSGAITIRRSHTSSGKGLILTLSAGAGSFQIAEEAFLNAE